MLINMIKPVRLFNLNNFKQDLELFSLNLMIWYNKVPKDKASKAEKIFLPK